MSPPAPSFWLRSFFLARPGRVHLLSICFILLGLHSYLLCGLAQFTYDDHQLIISNPSIRSFSGLPTVLASGRPLRGLTFMLDYQLYGLDPRGWHFTNLLWHLAGTLLFYWLLLRIFGRVRLAGLAAVMFAFHPVHAETVMAIAHRKEILAFTFMLLSYHFYLSRRRWPVLSWVGAGLCFFLALLGKQVAMVLPLLWVVQEWLGGEQKERGSLRRFLSALPFLFLGGALLLSALYFSAPILRDFNLFALTKPPELIDLGYDRILATSFSVYPRHLRYLFFPVHLHLDPHVELVTFASLHVWLGVVLFAALLLSAFALRRSPPPAFGLLWILINLLPIMNFIPNNAFFAERYLYIPSAGFALLLAAVWEKLFTFSRPLFSPAAYRLTGAVCLFLILVIMLAAFPATRFNALWSPYRSYHFDRTLGLFLSCGLLALAGTSLILMWEEWNLRRPRRQSLLEFTLLYLIMAVLAFGLGALMELILRHRLGLPEVGIEAGWQMTREWLQAHARPGPRPDRSLLNPSFTLEAELANVFLYGIGVPTLFLWIARRVIQDERRAGLNRGLAVEILLLLMMTLGTQKSFRNFDWASEPRLWSVTVMENPLSLHGWNNLGNAYVERRRFDLAAWAFSRATELAPRDFRVWRNLGMTYAQAGDFPAAAAAFEKAASLAPTDILSLEGLANSRWEVARQREDKEGMREVISLYLKILALNPSSARTHYNLAVCYFFLGDPASALVEVQKAITFDPASELYRQLEAHILSRFPPR